MKTLARITAVILIIFGIIIMLSGLTLGVVGIVRTGSRALGATPIQPGLRVAGAGMFTGLGGLILVIFIVIQGLMIIATGEGLYLLANISAKIIPASV
ncbi:MAG: hypothetical protein WBW94_04720 [Anaerolineales bacterium]